MRSDAARGSRQRAADLEPARVAPALGRGDPGTSEGVRPPVAGAWGWPGALPADDLGVDLLLGMDGFVVILVGIVLF